MPKRDILFASIISFLVHISFFFICPDKTIKPDSIKNEKVIEVTLIKNLRQKSIQKKCINESDSIAVRVKNESIIVSKKKRKKIKKLKSTPEIKKKKKLNIKGNEIEETKVKKVNDNYKQKVESIYIKNIENKEIVTFAVPDYHKNPKPYYPVIARRKGYQGIVVLKVLVLESGKAGEVRLLKSSGYSCLDNSAIKTMKNWQFIPGKKGDVAISMWVNVPIRFELKDKG